MACRQPPGRLGSRRASIRAKDSPDLPATASSTAIVLSQGRIGDSSFWPSACSTASRERPCCGAAVIGTSVRRPGALKFDPCEVPPVRFRLPPSPEQRMERRDDRLVAGC